MSEKTAKPKSTGNEKFEFTAANMEKYKELLSRCDDVESALLPVLHGC